MVCAMCEFHWRCHRGHRRRSDRRRGLLHAQHDRQGARPIHRLHPGHRLAATQRDVEEQRQPGRLCIECDERRSRNGFSRSACQVHGIPAAARRPVVHPRGRRGLRLHASAQRPIAPLQDLRDVAIGRVPPEIESTVGSSTSSGVARSFKTCAVRCAMVAGCGRTHVGWANWAAHARSP
jgi:hypothetical protein